MLRRHVTWRPWCQGVVASAQSVLWLLLVLLLVVVVAEVVVVVVVGSGGGVAGFSESAESGDFRARVFLRFKPRRVP